MVSKKKQAASKTKNTKNENASGSIEYSAVKHEVEYADLSHVPKGGGGGRGGGRPNKPPPLQSVNYTTVIREH